jgi:hypothetical protein
MIMKICVHIHSFSKGAWISMLLKDIHGSGLESFLSTTKIWTNSSSPGRDLNSRNVRGFNSSVH